jgi:hypothetical protein
MCSTSRLNPETIVTAYRFVLPLLRSSVQWLELCFMQRGPLSSCPTHVRPDSKCAPPHAFLPRSNVTLCSRVWDKVVQFIPVVPCVCRAARASTALQSKALQARFHRCFLKSLRRLNPVPPSLLFPRLHSSPEGPIRRTLLLMPRQSPVDPRASSPPPPPPIPPLSPPVSTCIHNLLDIISATHGLKNLINNTLELSMQRGDNARCEPCPKGEIASGKLLCHKCPQGTRC